MVYHSQEGNEVMGLKEVMEEAHQDPTTIDSKWVTVTIEPIRSLLSSVSLKRIKDEPHLFEIALIKQERLAVMKLGEEEIERIISLEKWI